MTKADEPIDRCRIAPDEAGATRSRGWRPSPLNWWFLAIASFDTLILFIASGVRSSGNDAAGNGMANAFQVAFVEAGTFVVGILALLFLIFRHRGIRIALTVLLVMMSLALPMLLS